MPHPHVVARPLGMRVGADGQREYEPPPLPPASPRGKQACPGQSREGGLVATQAVSQGSNRRMFPRQASRLHCFPWGWQGGPPTNGRVGAKTVRQPTTGAPCPLNID